MNRLWVIRILKSDNSSDYFVANAKGCFLKEPLQRFGTATETMDGVLINAANQNNRWGYLNADFEWAIKAQFDRAKSFNTTGYARVQSAGKWGVINSKGEVIIACQYPYATSIDGNFWFVSNDSKKTSLICLTNLEQYPVDIVLPTTSSVFAAKPTIYKVGNFGPCGLAPITVIKEDKFYTGYYDQKANLIIPFKEGRGGTFSKTGVAPFQDGKTLKYGLINVYGQWLLEPSHQLISNFNQDNIAHFKNETTGGCLNASGNIIFEYNLADTVDEVNLNCNLIKTKNAFIDQATRKAVIDFEESAIEYAHPFFEVSGISVIRGKTSDISIAPQWGIVDRRGRVFYNESWVEPLTKYKDGGYFFNVMIGHKHSLPAFITKQNTLEYILPNGNPIATLEFNSEKAILKDQRGKVLVQYSKQQLAEPELFFNRDFSQLASATDIELTELITELTASPAKPFKLVDFITGEERTTESRKIHDYNEYAINRRHLDEYELAALDCGAIKTLAVSYYSEYDCNNYPFLKEQTFDLFYEYYLQLRNQLILLLGDDYSSHNDWQSNSTEWTLADGRYLVLLNKNTVGNGDLQSLLCIYVTDKYYGFALEDIED